MQIFLKSPYLGTSQWALYHSGPQVRRPLCLLCYSTQGIQKGPTLFLCTYKHTLTVNLPEDSAKILEKQPPWQEVACIQYDGREQEQEKSIGTESWGGRVADTINNASHQQAYHDEETALRDHRWNTT